MKALVLFLAFALPVAAQETADPGALLGFTEAQGGSLRFLDKLTSDTGDVTLSRGQAAKFGRLVVRLDGCRYPTENPVSDAAAHLTIIEEETEAQLFSGWMLASSPALSALDHPRYDVWVLACILPDVPAEDVTPEE